MKCPWSSLPDENGGICSNDMGFVCLFKIMKDQLPADSKQEVLLGS